jgi:hypothetical protein
MDGFEDGRFNGIWRLKTARNYKASIEKNNSETKQKLQRTI